jgi:glutamate-1-semialdehyde 2,1-aminomutase
MATTPTSADPGSATGGLPHGSTIDQLIEAEEARMLARMPRARAMFEEAQAVMPGGVTSSWASTRPVPLWVDRGLGGHVWDVDGNEYVDLHAGYGVNVVGHAHPAIVEAVQRRVAMGTHFAQPTPDSIDVARMLGDRFGFPLWRFTNSGTESTMDAIHLMRAITGRDLIIKVEGAYHGHHDLVNVSLWRSSGDLGPVDDPVREPGPRIPTVSQG